MDNTSGILRFFQSICRFNFGNFEKEEFKKFLRMGVIFALMIGVYWTLRPLKDAVFIQLVDKLQLPFAKTVSVIALLPLVIFYTKLLEKTSREKMLVILPVFYGVAVVFFSFLVIALFWAFATDTTNAGAAKKGFPLVVAIGQMGGIIFPYTIGGLPHRLGLSTDALSMMC